MSKISKLIGGMMGDDDEEYIDDPYEEDYDSTPARGSKSSARRRSGGMEVVVSRPTEVDEAHGVTDCLLANKIVNLNLEGLDMAIAQRIIDFISGSTYALGGNLQKISNYIFLVTPKTVDVSGDSKDVDDSTGSFDVQKMV